MGKKDIQLKWYLGKDHIFADFCNGALYDSKQEMQKYYTKKPGTLQEDGRKYV